MLWNTPGFTGSFQRSHLPVPPGSSLFLYPSTSNLGSPISSSYSPQQPDGSGKRRLQQTHSIFPIIWSLQYTWPEGYLENPEIAQNCHQSCWRLAQADRLQAISDSSQALPGIKAWWALKEGRRKPVTTTTILLFLNYSPGITWRRFICRRGKG